MCGQLYRGYANATALSSSLVVSALGFESDDPGSSPGRGKASCPYYITGDESVYAMAECHINYKMADNIYAIRFM